MYYGRRFRSKERKRFEEFVIEKEKNRKGGSGEEVLKKLSRKNKTGSFFVLNQEI